MSYFLYDTIYGGIGAILIGIIWLIVTLKYTKPDMDSPLQPLTSGMVGSIGFIIAGVFCLIIYLKKIL